ncbi:hypothetical protein N1851_006069 [Merluccius polli]|uniref:Uncharacterized protein n=1 Tax=Merluccius polli TaxID=89951 RepID=A0AA47P9P1_MERPO|nr:hypothetical protein N1851_006069 [Merluccius polli]
MLEDEVVVGHLHTVSPMKTSRQSRRYFEATLQTGREAFNRVVCFSPEKRDEFVHAADNGQSMKLVGTRKSISYSNPGGFDVLVSSSSRLDVAGELAFPRRAPHTIDRLTIAGILALGPRQRVEVMEVRVLQVIENKVVQVQGTPVELKKFEVCDATGQTGLTVWDRLIMAVELGKCYTFSSLSTRKDGDRTVLTTTPSSVVTTTGQVGQPASISVMPVRGEETLRGPVTGVQIVAKPRCPRCHAGQEKLDVKLSTHRCERCSILQRTTAYVITYSGLLIVVGGDGEERSMVLSNSAVFAFVRERFLSGSAHDGPALEETVIAIPEVEVTINAEGLVVRFAEATVQGGQGNVLEAEQPSMSYARETGALVRDDESLGDLFQKD